MTGRAWPPGLCILQEFRIMQTPISMALAANVIEISVVWLVPCGWRRWPTSLAAPTSSNVKHNRPYVCRLVSSKLQCFRTLRA
jgi:hypothetical protein